ncbi:MAG: 50S ribosomal protein L31 [Spirochaetia bacterium]|nr:50S ribosomal protein L31 [Spirochaetia bacterium]
MKPGIHPEYKEATIRCSCGAEYKNRTTKGDMQVEVCAACHPFYTGKEKLLDAAGRVDRFKKKYKMK